MTNNVNEMPLSEQIEALNKELEIYRKQVETDPDAYSSMVYILDRLFATQQADHQYTEAEATSAELLKLCRKQAETNPYEYLPLTARTLYGLAILQKKTNRYTEAAAIHTESPEINRKFDELINEMGRLANIRQDRRNEELQKRLDRIKSFSNNPDKISNTGENT